MRFTLLSLALMSAIIPAGCDGGGGIGSAGGDGLGAGPPAGTISVDLMARHLGLRVIDSTWCSATLVNARNVVTIYADPAGQAYVNSKPVGASGGIASIGNVIYVPQGLEAEVRAAIRPWTRLKPPAPPTDPRPRKTAKTVARVRGTVVVDAGHGGSDPGAPSCIGGWEKDIVLDAAMAAAERLGQHGASVTLTRCGDVFIELSDRAAIANTVRAKLFVSVHADAAPQNHSAEGFTIYVCPSASPQSYAAARAIERRLSAAGAASRGVKEANYVVLRETRGPAVLVELGFLTNRAEAARLATATYRRLLGAAIADGVADYLK